jgi:hypothetical protein
MVRGRLVFGKQGKQLNVYSALKVEGWRGCPAAGGGSKYMWWWRVDDRGTGRRNGDIPDIREEEKDMKTGERGNSELCDEV